VSPAGRRAFGLVVVVDALRLLGAVPLGLGDAEALYASYAAHLQGGYLDHPPLIGWLDAAVLAVWSSPFALRLLALALFSASAWLLFRLARSLFDDEAAWWSVLLLCLVPVFHLGGLAAAPDAPLAVLWLLCLHAAWSAWKRTRKDPPPSWSWILAHSAALGALLGGAFLAKYSALALVPVLVVAAWPLGGMRRVASLLVGAVAAAAVASPVLAWNAAHGFASAAHRLVWSQPDAGVSLRNLGALAGGQLLYLSPLVAAGLVWVVARGWKERQASPVRFCLVGSLVPFALLAAVCLWSRVAEPHWPIPAWYALLPLAGRLVATGSRRVVRWAKAAVGVALGFDVLVYAAVLTPALPELVPEPLYVARYDIVNELYGWDDVAAAVRDRVPAGGVVAAGHYTMCAQLEWNLRGAGVRVTCWTSEPTDFDVWRPGAQEARGRPVLFVSDERYPERPGSGCGAVERRAAEVVEVGRGGATVRRFVLTVYEPGGVSWPRPVPCGQRPSGSN
jgi:hypothetical protein